MNRAAPPPLILVHGWAGSYERTWRRSGVVDLLQEAGRLVVPYDLPGHGTGIKSHDPAAYTHLTEHLLTHIETNVPMTGLPMTTTPATARVDAVGFSLGAITLLRALLQSPATFGKVVLSGIGDGVFSAHDSARSERILSGLEGRAEPGDVVARLFGKIGNEGHNDPQALAAVMRRPREAAIMKEQLAAIDNEILIILGDKDFSGPADALVASFPRARLISLQGIDHFRTPEAFEFINHLLAFMTP